MYSSGNFWIILLERFFLQLKFKRETLQIMNGNLIHRMLIFFVCFSGCVYHVFYVSYHYFSYLSTTDVESQLQDVVRYPSLIFCAKITDFISKSDLKKYNLSSRHELLNLSVAQLHSLTPATNETLLYCFLRIDEDNYYKEYPNNVCYLHFTVTKVITGIRVCYQFYPAKNLTYSIHQVANAFNYSYLLYELVLGLSFDSTTDVYMPAHYPSIFDDDFRQPRFPVNSRKFGESFFHSRNESWISCRPSQKIVKLLPAPYDTDCLENNEYCTHECIVNKTVDSLQRYPYTEPADEFLELKGISSDIKIISEHDLKDKKFAKKWSEIEQQCSSKCSRPSCERSVTENAIFANQQSMEYLAVHKVAYSLTVSAPLSYPSWVISVPEMNWIEYVSGISNCISIWFGISVVAVNPFQYLLKHNTFFKARSLIARVPIILYWFVLIIGFLYQSIELCRQYFKYDTSMTIEILSGDIYLSQSLGICLDYHILLNRSNHEAYGLSAKPPIEIQSTRGEAEYSTLTIKQIFELTPNNSEFIVKCKIRRNTNIGLHELGAIECLKHFDVLKAVGDTQMCYFVIPTKTKRFHWTQVASSERDITHVFQIQTSIKLSRSVLATVGSYEPAVGSTNRLPYDSWNFGHLLVLHPKNVIDLSSTTNTFSRLLPPFDTNCRPDFLFDGCVYTCISRELRPIKRRPYILLNDQPYDEKMLNIRDIRNKTVASMFRNAYKTCREECAGFPCYQSVSFTSAEAFAHETKKSIILVSTLPTSPTVGIDFKPSIDPLNFFINICNCFGFWFGLSMVSFNPIIFWEKKKPGPLVKENVSRNYRHKVLSASFLVACLAGFLWQGSLVSITFFSYSTYSRIEVSRTDTFRFPTINLCFPFKDMIPNESLDLTVDEIFALTPLESETLSKCVYPDLSSMAMKIRLKNECLSEFQTSKYVAGSRVCYVYQSKSLYSLHKLTSHSSQIVYEILLSPILSDSTELSFYWFTQAIDYEGGGEAVQSKKYVARALLDGRSNISDNYFIVTGVTYNVSLLSEPYDTQCIDNDSPLTCFSKCYINFTSYTLKRMPFEEFIFNPVSLKMLSEKDLTSKNNRELLSKGKEECRLQCLRQTCTLFYSIPEVWNYFNSEIAQSGLMVAAGSPSSNGYIIYTYPSLTLIDYLNNLAVSASIWLGVSVMTIALYPVKIMTNRLQKKEQRRSRDPRQKADLKQFAVSPRIYCPCSYCQMYYRNRRI